MKLDVTWWNSTDEFMVYWMTISTPMRPSISNFRRVYSIFDTEGGHWSLVSRVIKNAFLFEFYWLSDKIVRLAKIKSKILWSNNIVSTGWN